MQKQERHVKVRRLARAMAQLGEAQADFVLTAAGVSPTPALFRVMAIDQRVAALLGLLSDAPDEALARLGDAEAAPGSDRQRLAAHLALMTAAEAAFVLEQVGIRGTPALTFGRLARTTRQQVLLHVLPADSPAVAQLMEALEGELAPAVPDVQPEEAVPVPPAAEVAPPPPAAAVAPPQPSPVVDQRGPIFVVHGHDRAIRHEVVRVLERGTGREVIVLHEQPNAGRVLLEKFEDHAASAAYAVVLVTADDHGGSVADASQRPRGRQNVVFELGYFFGKLGRDRVAVLLEPGVEKPSDIDGLVYVALDPGGAWKQQLARELDSAGLEVNYARIP
jgi:predicted nucleotide-binding protein